MSELMNTMSRLAGFNIVGTKTRKSALDYTRVSNVIGHCHCVNFLASIVDALIVACKRSHPNIRRDIICQRVINAQLKIINSLVNCAHRAYKRAQNNLM